MIKKPSQKTVVNNATKIGAGIVGAKLSDGVAAIMPESTNSYKKGAIALVSLVAAASIDSKTTAGEVVQSALVGMAIKQGSDAITEMLVPAIDPQDGTKTAGKFINAVVGHDSTSTPPPATTQRMLNRSINSPYQWNGGQNAERVTPVSLPVSAPLGV